jgi:hypothetical protein
MQMKYKCDPHGQPPLAGIDIPTRRSRQRTVAANTAMVYCVSFAVPYSPMPSCIPLCSIDRPYSVDRGVLYRLHYRFIDRAGALSSVLSLYRQGGYDTSVSSFYRQGRHNTGVSSFYRQSRCTSFYRQSRCTIQCIIVLSTGQVEYRRIIVSK